jgi:hypothetical protein
MHVYIIGAERKAQVRPPSSILNNMSYGQNFSSASGEPEFIAQYEFVEIPASVV